MNRILKTLLLCFSVSLGSCDEDEAWYVGNYEGPGEEVGYYNQYNAENELISSVLNISAEYPSFSCQISEGSAGIVAIQFQKGFEQASLDGKIVGNTLIVPDQSYNEYGDRLSGTGKFDGGTLRLELLFVKRWIFNHYYY
ncbi:MAG TPA: hypothetical protein VEB86_20125, partial [Chryseosolibacter sp.]|nr:hypothetical protein [Chryseosolibacter sp.]